MLSFAVSLSCIKVDYTFLRGCAKTPYLAHPGGWNSTSDERLLHLITPLTWLTPASSGAGTFFITQSGYLR